MSQLFYYCLRGNLLFISYINYYVKFTVSYYSYLNGTLICTSFSLEDFVETDTLLDLIVVWI